MINPRCKRDYIQDYINADGLVIPCSWLGEGQALKDYKDLHRDYLDDLRVTHRELDQILEDPRYLKIEKSWNTVQPFSGCTRNCAAKPATDEADFQYGHNAGCKINLK